MRTVRRLRLRFLLLRPSFPNPNGFHIPVLSTNLLFALSKPSHPHHKSTNANTTSTTTTPIAKLVKSSFILISLWWRWRESNPRPEHFSLCFIQQYIYYTIYLVTRQIYLLCCGNIYKVATFEMITC